jgi:hypothetical protein
MNQTEEQLNPVNPENPVNPVYSFLAAHGSGAFA